MTLSSVKYKSSRVRILKPYPLNRKLKVKPVDSGTNIIEFLSVRFPFISPKTWKERVCSGWISIEGRELTVESLVYANDEINHYSPSVKEPSVPDEVKILDESSDWLIIYKPAPMPMHQGGRYVKNTVLNIVHEMGFPEARMVHRLDAVTSGLVVLARNRETAKKLQELFSGGRVEKIYHAIVKGRPNFKEEIVTAPIRRKKGFIFEAGDHLAQSKRAKTVVKVLEEKNGETLVECRPLTGRTHQIRLHLHYIGFPILDDPIYGPSGDMSGKAVQNRAISLQCAGLAIPELSIDQVLPDDLSLSIKGSFLRG